MGQYEKIKGERNRKDWFKRNAATDVQYVGVPMGTSASEKRQPCSRGMTSFHRKMWGK